MTPETALTTIIRPGLAWLGKPFDSPEAACQLLAQGMHESGYRYRYQRDSLGRELPTLARGYWQFELDGVRAATTHRANGWIGGKLADLGYGGADDRALHHAVAHSELLMLLLARAMLWWVPEALPAIGDRDGAYAYYLRAWNPGARRKDAWGRDYARACALFEVVPA